MPELSMGKIDTDSLPKDVHNKYEHMIYLTQRKYYMAMLLLGCVLFLFGAFT